MVLVLPERSSRNGRQSRVRSYRAVRWYCGVRIRLGRTRRQNRAVPRPGSSCSSQRSTAQLFLHRKDLTQVQHVDLSLRNSTHRGLLKQAYLDMRKDFRREWPYHNEPGGLCGCMECTNWTLTVFHTGSHAPNETTLDFEPAVLDSWSEYSTWNVRYDEPRSRAAQGAACLGCRRMLDQQAKALGPT
jgi:hypothetical protein